MPNGDVVAESQLPNLGYVLIRGLWFNRARVEQFIAAQQPNVNPVQVAQNIFSQIQNVANSFQDVRLIFQQFVPTADVETIIAGDPGGDYSGFV